MTNEEIAWGCIALHGIHKNMEPCEIIQTYGVVEEVRRVKEALDNKDLELRKIIPTADVLSWKEECNRLQIINHDLQAQVNKSDAYIKKVTDH